MNRNKALKRVAALSLGLVLAAVAAEIGVRILVGEQPKFPRRVVGAPWGLRYNEPGARYRHKSADVEVHFSINAQGMRAERGFAYAKPDGTFRVVCLGDSFTIGYEVDFEDTFASVLERELGAAGLRVEVLNAGVSGYSNAEECLYLERELHRYDPDLVLVSFFNNDLDDNVRTGLFALEDGELVTRAEDYVPAGRLGDFLNRSRVFNWLSERSDAFAVAKEKLTLLLKRRMVADERAGVDPGPEALPSAPAASAAGDPATYEARLAAAIFERMLRWCSERDLPLVIQSIPLPLWDDRTKLIDAFPYEHFDVERPGLHFFAAKDILAPHSARELLYWERSHSHWTPFAHRLAGKALADLILSRQLLE